MSTDTFEFKQTMRREEAIDWLVQNDLDDIVNAYQNENDTQYVRDLLRFGFSGYTSFTNDQLAEEVSSRQDEFVNVEG
jgi:hypothetical protein